MMQADKLKHQSLGEVNGSIVTPKTAPFWKKLLAYSGPGALVAVGYMDPGNWVTSIGGGASYGYLLLSVVLISSLIAMLLQYMAGKLGIVTGLDLAQATRLHTNKWTGGILWLVTELAIMATDIAEVVGGAIALNLLFGIPIWIGVILTVLDVFLLLLLMRLGFRKIEAIVVSLICLIMLVFAYEVALSHPYFPHILAGYAPNSKLLAKGQLAMALGIVGATVMPHNLFLHSSLSQTRDYDRQDPKALKEAVRFMTWDSNIQLSVAFVINSLLLILGASFFFGKNGDFGTFKSVYQALKNPDLAGSVASPILSTLFAVALLASGQNSTITGTLSGQIVMEGFLHIKIPAWSRRLLTRLLSVIPVLIVAILYRDNEQALDEVLLGSQIFLSIALPFSIVPLVYFTSSKKIMGVFANKPYISAIGWLMTALLVILNLQLIIGFF